MPPSLTNRQAHSGRGEGGGGGTTTLIQNRFLFMQTAGLGHRRWQRACMFASKYISSSNSGPRGGGWNANEAPRPPLRQRRGAAPARPNNLGPRKAVHRWCRQLHRLAGVRFASLCLCRQKQAAPNTKQRSRCHHGSAAGRAGPRQLCARGFPGAARAQRDRVTEYLPSPQERRGCSCMKFGQL